MKQTKILSLLLVMTLICGCKKENWMDWQIENQLWLQENAKKEGVVTTPTGLQYKCIDPGWEHSARPDNAKYVTIRYSGSLINGYVFDSAESYTSNVSSFVSGFTEGLKKMNQFGVYEFYIPYDLAYGVEGRGAEGSSSFIPPYSTLIFHVYLHSIN